MEEFRLQAVQRADSTTAVTTRWSRASFIPYEVERCTATAPHRPSPHRIVVPPPLSVSISGPSAIESKDTYSWMAHPFSGTGAYSYSWQFCPTSGSCSNVGNQQTLSMVANAGAEFELRVTVQSVGETATATYQVCGVIVP